MYDEGARLRHRSRQSPQKLYRNKKKMVEADHWDQNLSSLQRYRIIKQARGHHLNLKKTIRMVNIIASVATAVVNDQRIGTRSLHAAH